MLIIVYTMDWIASHCYLKRSSRYCWLYFWLFTIKSVQSTNFIKNAAWSVRPRRNQDAKNYRFEIYYILIFYYYHLSIIRWKDNNLDPSRIKSYFSCTDFNCFYLEENKNIECIDLLSITPCKNSFDWWSKLSKYILLQLYVA